MKEQDIITELINIKTLSLETANRCDKVLRTLSKPKKRKSIMSEAELLKIEARIFKPRKN